MEIWVMDFRQLDRDNFDNWDYGLVGGVGFNFGDIQLGARYNYGLNEIARVKERKGSWVTSKTQLAKYI